MGINVGATESETNIFHEKLLSLNLPPIIHTFWNAKVNINVLSRVSGLYHSSNCPSFNSVNSFLKCGSTVSNRVSNYVVPIWRKLIAFIG